MTSSTINGTAGNDTLTGTSGNDSFNVSQGGNDSVNGGAGDDTIQFGATLTSADHVDGGSGNDTVTIKGDYSGANAVTFLATTMVNVETLTVGSGFDYSLTTNDATVAAGGVLKLNASTLLAGDDLTFDGSAETDGSFRLIGGAGTNTVTGGAKNDTFDLSRGVGHDTAHGGAGNDTFDMGSALLASDVIDGGTGVNTVVLDGLGTSGTIVLGATTMTNIQKLTLEAGHNYNITTNDATVAAGADFIVNATQLGATDTFTFDGSAEDTIPVSNLSAPLVNGNFTITTGLGTYNLTGGAGNDVFQVGATMTGADHVNGNTGIDHVVMNGDYTGTHALKLGVDGMESIQVISLKGGHSYNISAVAGSFGPASVLPTTFTCYTFGAGDNFTLSDGAETSLQDRIFAGAGTYNLKTGAAIDFFAFGSSFAAGNTLDGGGGNDVLSLNGNFQQTQLNGNYTGTNALTFGATQLKSIENLGLTGGYSYNITTNDANVAAGGTLTIQANSYSAYAGGGNVEMLAALKATDSLTFNGSAETNGHFVFNAGAGAYTLTGGKQSDTFNMGANFVATDTINGGGGNDVLTLNGDYSGAHALVFAAHTMTNIGKLVVDAGHNYNITMNDANVAAGAKFTVDATALGAGDNFTFNDGPEKDGELIFDAGAGTYTIDGSHQDDTFSFGATFKVADSVDGGALNDTLLLDGDYSGENALAFTATTITNVETIRFAAGHSYSITTNDANVAAGHTLSVNGSLLGADDNLTFDASQDLDGKFRIIGGAGTNDLTGGAKNDVFDLSRGDGHDTANGGGGSDTFDMGSALVASDQIDGGANTSTGAPDINTLVLDGMGNSDGLVFNDTTITNIQKITLEGGHDYSITTANGNVAAGALLIINASAVGVGNTFTFDGSAEDDSAVINPKAQFFNGNFTITTGAGTYNLTGGAGDDTFQVGAGMTSSDHIDGGTGIDHVVMDGDYSGAHALNLAVGGMTSIQVIALRGGHSYTINAVEGSFGPANVLPTTFTCYGPDGLGVGDNFTLNDSGETGIQDRIFAGNLGSTYNLTTGAAADLFTIGGNFVAADTFNGGGGFDTLALNSQFQGAADGLNADYTGPNALVLGADQLTSVEAIGLSGGYSYDITTNDGNVAAGATMAIEANSFSAYAGGGDKEIIPALKSTDTLTFNGSAETDGHFDFQAGAGAYHITGGHLADTFEFGASLVASDTINGGGGADELSLNGDYSAGLTFGATTMTNIATLTLDAGHNYNLTTNDATVASGQTLTVDASALGSSNSLTFNGAAETNGAFHFISGAGADNFTGGAGADIFDYTHAGFSGAAFDTVTGFNFANDTVAFHTVTGTDAAVTSGSLSEATFDSDLATALAGHLDANHAILFTANAGDLSGDTFLVIDGNGTAGYQGGSDLVIHLVGDTNTADFTTGAWATA